MSALEQWVLNGTALNDDTNLTLESISDPPAAKKPEWVSGADSDGAGLGRDPKYENKVLELRLRVAKQATMDLALAKVAAILDQLQECGRNARGLPLVWMPADATTAAVTWRCLLGEITDLPKDWQDSGYFVRTPLLTVRLTCLPFGEGTETLLGTVTDTAPMQTLEVSGVGGDVPALGRLVVTDAASQSRRWIPWGLESRWYPTSSPPSLIIDSTSMVTSGYGGVTNTRTGAYSGASNNVIRATLRTQAQAVCGLGNLTHVGAFRPHLRFYASAATMAVRLTWQALDGPLRSLTYKVPVVAGWNLVDLGLIGVPQAPLGSQRWTGRIEAYSTATGGETLDVDVMLLMPAELFGRARASYAYAAGVVTAYDEFTGLGIGTVLNNRGAPVGGTWVTSGATTDLAGTGGSEGETAKRSTTSDTGLGRYAILGSTNYTDTECEGAFYRTANPGSIADPFHQAAIVRWVDASNYLTARCRPYSYSGSGTLYSGSGTRLTVVRRVAGVETVLATLDAGYDSLVRWVRPNLIAYASGRWIATLYDANRTVIGAVQGSDTSLATGGALASGKPGFNDYYGGTAAIDRYADDFSHATPAPEPIVCYAGQSIEFRHDTTLREDATGTYAGPPPEYVGSRFFIPNAGGPGRKVRIAVMARRNDVSTMADDFIADSTTVDVYATPRYLVVPR